MGKDTTPDSSTRTDETIRQIKTSDTRISEVSTTPTPEATTMRKTSDTIDNIKKAQEPQPEKTPDSVVDIPELPPREYDVDLIDSFIALVFGDGLAEDEHILTWKVKPKYSPSFPMTDEALLTALDRTKKANALYFGTSTCRRDADGKLYNRKALFKRLAVVVLDDIGTKVPFDKIPESAPPTYKLETSAGNFQYGYVLSEDLTDLPAATALIQLLYSAGYSDEGGKMPTKLVRLPEGVNGKLGVKCGFVNKLHFMDGPKWSPSDLIDAFDIPTTWDAVLADAEDAVKRVHPRSIGTSPWSGAIPEAPSLSGIVDPVLEWMYEQDMVVQDLGAWVTIQCPWNYAHTSGDNFAGYAPVGRGEFGEYRAFNCFHGHCETNKIAELLSYVAANGGPTASVFDPVAQLTKDWAYDPVNELAWHVTSPASLDAVSMGGFRGLYPQSVRTIKSNGQEAFVKHSSMWLTSPARATVYGQVFDPSTPARIVEKDGKFRVNTFHPPMWPEVEPDKYHVDMFLAFMEYLLPYEDQRDYFLKWLSAKVNDMSFRGCAMLMIAKAQGTGRSTLGDMLTTLFTPHNVENIPFDKIIGEAQFNDWMESPLVITDETLNTGDTNKYRVYERLKEIIDPRSKRVRINPKYGRQRFSDICSSYLMLSNHEDALAIADNDRRIYVITNPILPAAPHYFTTLNEWLDVRDDNNLPVWAIHVWHYLKNREYNVEELLAPPAQTDVKLNMRISTESPLDTLTRATLASLPTEYVNPRVLELMAVAFHERLDLYDLGNWKKILRARIRACTAAYGSVTVNLDGITTRPRLNTLRVTKSTIMPGGKVSIEERLLMREGMDANLVTLKKAVREILDTSGL